MKKSKKLLSILLTICMLLSAVPIVALPASAAELWGDSDTPAANQIFYTATGELNISDLDYSLDMSGAEYGILEEQCYFADGKGILTFTDDITSVTDQLFYGNLSLISVILPEGVTSVGCEAFYDCDFFKSISMPGVTSIGDYAFYECMSLESVSMPVVETIGESAFEGASDQGAENVVLDMPKVTSIGNAAFKNFVRLDDVSMPEIVTIPNEAFNSCDILDDVYIPKVTSIGDAAFADCESLFLKPDIDIYFENIESIGEYAFSHCYELKVNISLTKITELKTGTFYGSGITGISIPNVTSISEEDVFSYCANLKFVYAKPDIETTLNTYGIYSLEISETENGSISIEDMKTTLEEGCNVYCQNGLDNEYLYLTVNVQPDENYELNELKYNETEIKENEDGYYTFTMPASDVTVSATFKKTVTDPEFYAVLNKTEETGKVANTLSFYYDTNKENYSDTTKYTVYSGDALPTNATNETDWGYDNDRANIKNVVIDKSVEKFTGLTSTACMFYNFKYADDISGCEYLNVSNVTNMSKMFYNYAYNSTSIAVVPDVSNWNTENVTDVSNIFYEYAYKNAGLDAVPDVSNWNTGNVTDMQYMFAYYAYNSTSITAVPDVSNWNTANVTNMKYLFFYYGKSSTTITDVPDVSNWNTEKVTNMMSMFASYGRNSTATLQPLDLSSWNIENLTNATNILSSYGKSNSGNPIVYGTEWSTKTGVTSYGVFSGSTLKNAASTFMWESANTKDTCCFTSKYVIDEAVANATYSAFLTLKDNIDISFKMKDLGTDKNGAGFDKTKLSFTVNGTDLTKSATFTYADGVASGMTVSVSPEEMSKNVHIVVKYNGGKIKDFYYSVLSYCNSVATAYASDNDTYAKLNDLCTAVLNYGKYAEDNKNGNTSSKLNSSCKITEWSEIETVSGSSSAEANAAASLTLGSTISLNFYVTDTVTANQVKIYNDNDEQVEAKYITVTDSDKEGYNTKITVSGIYAEHLSNAYTLKVDDEKMITYGVYNYCADVVAHETDETYTETLQTLCKAIYNYGEKAAAYAA